MVAVICWLRLARTYLGSFCAEQWGHSICKGNCLEKAIRAPVASLNHEQSGVALGWSRTAPVCTEMSAGGGDKVGIGARLYYCIRYVLLSFQSCERVRRIEWQEMAVMV